ncbi:MAG: Gfo/Idh/MocA family oxidoreductase [Rhodopirellula sp.]|nr:Gfo/Idh/MocA family oxidoreductase [Rhodopirellula sp.]
MKALNTTERASAHGLTRRRFLAWSAATATASIGGPSVIPSSALGRDGAAAPSERITVGMIGVGRQVCAYNLRRFAGQPDCQVVALCDVDRWRLDVTDERVASFYGAKRKIENFGNPDRYTDFRELLARADIDAVVISTPDHWHVPMAVMAAQAGKDVALEKPITRTIPEGRLLVEAIRKHNRVFRMDSEFRSISAFHRACELVRNGRIGRIKRIVSGVPKSDTSSPTVTEVPVPKDLDYDLWLGPAPRKPYCEARVHENRGYERPGWMRISDYCDGMILNWGAHLNDIVQWGNNSEHTCPVEVEAVFCDRSPNGQGLWDVLGDFEVHYRYADGVELAYKSDSPYVRFEGEEGWVQAHFGRRGIEAEPASILDSQIKPNELHLPLMTEERDFLDCVRSRKKTLENEEVAHRTTSLCHLGLIALRVGNGMRLHWDPEAERFTNSNEANQHLVLPSARDPWSYDRILNS